MLLVHNRYTLTTLLLFLTCSGNLKDGADAAAEIENICVWLMDEDKCPTKWDVLLTTRNQNPMYRETAKHLRWRERSDLELRMSKRSLISSSTSGGRAAAAMQSM